MFIKRIPKREFKLRAHENKSEIIENENDDKFVHFLKPDRSHYPRILDFWPVFVIVGLLAFVTILIIRWMS